MAWCFYLLLRPKAIMIVILEFQLSKFRRTSWYVKFLVSISYLIMLLLTAVLLQEICDVEIS